jgi:hypothetical protein
VRVAVINIPAKIDNQEAINDCQQSVYNMLDPDNGYTALTDSVDLFYEEMTLLFRQAAGDFIEK